MFFIFSARIVVNTTQSIPAKLIADFIKKCWASNMGCT